MRIVSHLPKAVGTSMISIDCRASILFGCERINRYFLTSSPKNTVFQPSVGSRAVPFSVVLALLCLFTAASARAQSGYSIIDLGDLGGGFSRARAINGFGQIVGESLLPGEAVLERGVSWQGGRVTDLGTFGGSESAAFGINNGGVICGWAQNSAGASLAALWNGGSIIALPTLGGAAGVAYGINDDGITVGVSSLTLGGYHAAFWSEAGVRDLGTLGGAYSIAYDVNNGGRTVGTASNSSQQDRAVLWDGLSSVDLGNLSGGSWTAARGINDSGQVILWGKPSGSTQNRATIWSGDPESPAVSLGTFGGAESWALGLNDNGFVVGYADEANGTSHAFVWDGTEMSDLGTLGGFYSAAYAINDQGIIVGYAYDNLGNNHAVAWIPIPEPSISTLSLLGGAIAVWANWRHRRLRPCGR